MDCSSQNGDGARGGRRLVAPTAMENCGLLCASNFLASTRDYNTGKYHHEGLAARFQAEAACHALELAHRQIFYRIAARSLEELVGEVEHYVSSSRQSPEEVLHVWQKLEPYRVALPVDVNVAIAQLFVSNVKLALAILRRRQEQSATRAPMS